MVDGQQRVVIENVKPQINCGKFPIKRVVGEKVEVEADIYCDSHDVLNAELMFKNKDKAWQYTPLKPRVNDLWKGEFTASEMGTYSYSIIAWIDNFKSWHRDILKKIEAVTESEVDFMIGKELIQEVVDCAQDISKHDKERLLEYIALFSSTKLAKEDKKAPIINQELYELMIKYPIKKHTTTYQKNLEVFVDREKAGFSSWYEFFPRSVNSKGSKHGTFKDCIEFLPYVSDMGFDVIYLPPIHRIGQTKRKARNTSVTSEEGDPGSPWAIGAKEGGHKAINPELGSLYDFLLLIEEAHERNIEIAMDVAFQCSPDHPYIKEHPEWFKHRPDGSLQFAENPPKKYEDIYPINFETKDWKNLWEELKSVFLYWIEKGVKIFRVDNPHTKSLPFWGWTINSIKKQHPEVLFLAEAFTRPKVMYNLAKQGFTQSYTYFTWRNTKYELTSYCEELVNTDTREFFRPNFWPNTPDILPEYLQITNKAGYIQRLILAATLSSNYGMYGPAFELMDREPVLPGKEEYLNSEKYELKDWNIEDPLSLKKIISRINRSRKENRALQNTHSLKFHEALICYSKTTDDLSNIILVVVNLDPNFKHGGWIKVPIDQYKLTHHESFQVHDLISGSYYLWNGEMNYVEIDPGIMPAHIFRIRRKVATERDFDYFM